MKNLLVALFLSVSGLVVGQQSLNQFNWDDPIVFKNSGNPYVRSYGDLSDSLSSMTNDEVDFYYHDGEYFVVQSWADYFNWFTTKYSYRFALSTDVYKFHYLTGNNVEMMRFLNNECVSETIHLSPAVANVEWDNVNSINENRKERSTSMIAFTPSAFEKENKFLISKKKGEDAISNRKDELQLSQSQRDLKRMQSTNRTSRPSSVSNAGASSTTGTAKNTSNTKGLRKN